MFVPGDELSEVIFARSTRVSLAVSKDLSQPVMCLVDELVEMVGARTFLVPLRLTRRSVIVGGELGSEPPAPSMPRSATVLLQLQFH